MESKKPIHKVSVRGVKASVWLNASKRGPMRSVTLERFYKVGDTFMSSNSYSESGELDSALQALGEAKAWLKANPISTPTPEPEAKEEVAAAESAPSDNGAA